MMTAEDGVNRGSDHSRQVANGADLFHHLSQGEVGGPQEPGILRKGHPVFRLCSGDVSDGQIRDVRRILPYVDN